MIEDEAVSEDEGHNDINSESDDYIPNEGTGISPLNIIKIASGPTRMSVTRLLNIKSGFD